MPVVSVPRATELAAIVVANERLPLPSNDPLVPVTSPVRVIVLPVAHFVAVDALPDNAAVIVPAEKLPDPSRNTIVLAVLAFVAFDVTVNVAPSALAEPDKPLPLTAPVAT